MSASAPATRRAPALSPYWRLALLAGANLIASVGGGRVLSAGKGVAGITVLGSGSLLAFLAGSALGLGLLVLARRYPLGRSLAVLSVATVLSPIFLIVCLWAGAPSPVPGAGSPTLSGLAAWLFFGGLLARCALWFASRSLRSDVAATAKLSWLALAEAAYFGGFIVGLLLGPVSAGEYGSVVSTLLLDVLLLAVVAGGDLLQWRLARSGGPVAATPTRRPAETHTAGAFWRLTGAFAASAVACQVVVFHFADVLGRTRGPGLPAWSDATVAAFYLGVATAAALCSTSKPLLQWAGRRTPVVRFHLARRVIGIPLELMAALAGVLILLGIWGITTALGANAAASPWSAPGLLSLAALAVGAGLYELLVLAVVGRVSYGGSGAVALCIGLAAAAAAIALFLMMLAELRFAGWAIAAVVGLALTAWLVRDAGAC